MDLNTKMTSGWQNGLDPTSMAVKCVLWYAAQCHTGATLISSPPLLPTPHVHYPPQQTTTAANPHYIPQQPTTAATPSCALPTSADHHCCQPLTTYLSSPPLLPTPHYLPQQTTTAAKPSLHTSADHH